MDWSRWTLFSAVGRMGAITVASWSLYSVSLRIQSTGVQFEMMEVVLNTYIVKPSELDLDGHPL